MRNQLNLDIKYLDRESVCLPKPEIEGTSHHD